MVTKSTPASRLGWIALAMAGAGAGVLACKQGPTPEQVALMAQKDSLVQEVVEQSRLLSDISAELAQVQVEGKQLAIKTESPRTAQRDTIFARINLITGRLGDTEKRLQESRRRMRSLTHLSDSLKASLESTISNYESVLASQKTTIAQLTAQVGQLEAQNAELTVAKTALADTARQLAHANSTVYYVVGTKDELLQRGLIQEEGGSRFLFIFGKRGKVLVPARDLQPGEFTPIDKHQVTEIPLPEDAEYRVASRQNIEALATRPDKNGRIKGTVLKIAEPDKFWVGSKFLIIVRG